MIIFIQSLYFVIKFAIRVYKRHKALQNFTNLPDDGTAKDNDELERLIEESLQFDPPVFRQRYVEVQQVLLDKRWRHVIKKVVDFGCAELSFFIYLKNMHGINQVLEVDYDIDVIDNYKYKVQPLTADFLSDRSEPFKVDVLCGSIADPDYRLSDVDAVIGIEIIEHLFPDTLEALPFNIFGYINPRVAIFTTPNADFNILFSNNKRFRHWDHKFEWTREQFQDWANNICTRFPEYSVTFHGIGAGPKGTESLGSCTQMAVFSREYTKILTEVPDDKDCAARRIHRPEESFGVCTYFSYSKQIKTLQDLRGSNISDTTPHINNEYYKLVQSVDYPYTVDNRSAEDKILQEAVYIIYRNATYNSRYYNEDTDNVEIPLHELVHNFEGYFTTVEEIREILIKSEFDVKECSLDGSNPCVIYPIRMDKQSTPNSSVKSEQEYNIDLSHDAESEWECEPKTKPEEENESPVEPSEQLFDSGYQKSISNTEWSPTSPLDGTFEEHFNSFLKLDVNDIKENMKVVDDNAGELDAVLEQDQQNQNDIPNELEGVPMPEPMPLVDYDEDESEAALAIEDPMVVNHASREALFDPDSQLDMLEDFPETQQGVQDVEPIAIPVIIRVDQIADGNIGVVNEANPFPNWLLQLLGQQVDEAPEENHDEPHFYCQGDGLGVHPSVIEVDVDDSSSSESSSNDEAQAEQTLSEEDVGPLPTDGNAEQNLGIELVGQAMLLRATTSAISNDSNEEFFDTIEDTNFKE